MLIKTSEAIVSHVFVSISVSRLVSVVDKMKIEPAMILVTENTTSSKIVDQNDDFIAKEGCKSFSVF